MGKHSLASQMEIIFMIHIFVKIIEKIHSHVTTIIGVLYDHHFLLITIENTHNLKKNKSNCFSPFIFLNHIFII